MKPINSEKREDKLSKIYKHIEYIKSWYILYMKDNNIENDIINELTMMNNHIRVLSSSNETFIIKKKYVYTLLKLESIFKREGISKDIIKLLSLANDNLFNIPNIQITKN